MSKSENLGEKISALKTELETRVANLKAEYTKAAEDLDNFNKMFAKSSDSTAEAPARKKPGPKPGFKRNKVQAAVEPVKVKGKPGPKPKAKPEVEAAPKVKGKPGPKPKAKPEVEAAPKVKGKPGPKPKAKPEVAPKPKGKPGPKPKAEKAKPGPKPKAEKVKQAKESSNRASEGRAAVASGSRPPIKKAIAQVMGDKVMHASEVFEALKAKNWLPNSSDPRTYIAFVLSSNKEIFARVPERGRGYYQVDPDAFKESAEAKPEAPKAKPEAPKAKPEAPKAAAPKAKKVEKTNSDAILAEAGIGPGSTCFES